MISPPVDDCVIVDPAGLRYARRPGGCRRRGGGYLSAVGHRSGQCLPPGSQVRHRQSIVG
eukprot:6480395-Lingulodinium_polyedra.AAC.1